MSRSIHDDRATSAGAVVARGSLRAVIAAAICIQAAQGIFDVSLPLRAESAGLSATAFGWTGAAHAAGFLAGAFLAPAALQRFGGYGVLVGACILACPLAGLGWVSTELAWLLARVAAGFAFAMLFAATDTAVIDTADVKYRSRAIGIYVMFERLSMMVMPFAFAGRLSSPSTITYGVLCLWIALIPGRTLLRSHPPTNGIGLKLWSTFGAAWKLAPRAVLCAFAAGALNSSALLLLPRWVHNMLGESAVPIIQAAAWFGALTVQLGTGFLGGPKLRTHLGMWLSPAAGAVLLVFPLAARAGVAVTTVTALILGISAFSQYGLALIAMGDIAARHERPPPTAALVFAWGLGAVAGPALCSAAGLYAAPGRLFTVLGLAWLSTPLVTGLVRKIAARQARFTGHESSAVHRSEVVAILEPLEIFGTGSAEV